MTLKRKMLFETSIKYAQMVSSQIAKVKVYILYTGKNRNQTHFSKHMVEQKLIPSLYGMPIIGEFIQDKDDFGSHGGKVVIKDDDVTFEQTTVALGFVPESSEIKWEEVEELNGTKREYLTATAYVWYKRFPEVEKILEEPRNQSMEIDIKEAEWKEDIRAYDILDAEISGLCILGKSVEPCFEGARIGKFSLGDLKQDFALMAQELKEVIKDSEVKTEMKEQEVEVVETETVEEVVETVEVAEVAETVETVEETATEEPTEEFAELGEAQPEEETQEEEEAGTAEEIVQELAEKVDEMVADAPEGTDETAISNAETAVENVETAVEELVEAIENPTTETEEASEFEVKDFEKENEALKQEMEVMKQELHSLREFKMEKTRAEKQDLVKSFEAELSEEELAPIKEGIDSIEAEALETQLFALLGKKKMNFTAVKPAENKTQVVLTSYEHEDSNVPAWARAIEKHTRNKQ